MFIKKTKSKGYEYIKLVESYRENGTVKHNVLFNFGRADIIKQDKSFIGIVRKLIEIAELPENGIGIKGNPEMAPLLDGCSEAMLYNYGYLAYLKLWKELYIEGALEEAQCPTKIEYSLSQTVFLMAAQHLLEPRSKLGTFTRQERYFNMEKIKLQNIYRSLDILQENKEEIENTLFQFNYIRAQKKVDVVFYDVTTFEFESVVVDELKDFGFSKACKFNEVQVVMGITIDADGMPVGYELFKGNTFDGNTMVKSLENISARFKINRVIIVADRGINNKGNLNKIKGAGYGYIMASKIKTMKKEDQEKLFEQEGFTIITDKTGAEMFRYKKIDYVNEFTDENKIKQKLEESLVVSYSVKRAKKDRKDRERMIEKAKALLEQPQKIKVSNRRGYKKYIVENGRDKNETYALSMEKIENDEKYDGYYGIQTSEKEMSPLDVMDAYHTLWKIEESFRIIKSTMEVRPIFHWTPKRIEGHFVLCFLAFLMERKMELILKNEKDETESSPERIQESLNTMQLAAITINEVETFIKVKSDPLGNKIFKALKINIPSNISSKMELIDHFCVNGTPDPIQMSLFG